MRGHVQAEGASVEASLLSAPERDKYAREWRSLQLLLLLDVLRDAAGAGAASQRASQQPVAQQEHARLTIRGGVELSCSSSRRSSIGHRTVLRYADRRLE